MPVTGPNSYGSLTWLRNAAARALGQAAYSSLGALDQAAVDDAAAGAMDRMALEGAHQWHRSEDGFVTSAGYSTGTVTVTLSSPTVTGVGTLWIANLLARDVFNRGQGGFYRLNATPTSDTSLTLASPYSDATAATVTYNTFRDQYALPDDFLRLLSVREIDNAYELQILSRGEWAKLWHGDYETGRPRFCFLADSDDGLSSTGQYLQLYPIPDAVYGYQVLYDGIATWPAAGGTAVPGAPVAMQALAAGMLSHLFMADPQRGPAYEVAYQRLSESLRRHQDRTIQQRIFAKGQFGSTASGVWPVNYAPTIGENLG